MKNDLTKTEMDCLHTLLDEIKDKKDYAYSHFVELNRRIQFLSILKPPYTFDAF